MTTQLLDIPVGVELPAVATAYIKWMQTHQTPLQWAATFHSDNAGHESLYTRLRLSR